MNTTKSSVTTLTPQQAQEKLQNGMQLLDVREYPEWANAHIPGSVLVPLGKLKRHPERGLIGAEILIICATGNRARQAAEAIGDRENTSLAILEGGITAWQNAGLTTARSSKAPLSLERQVRIGAGSLILLGVLFPPLRFLTYFVPCGLIFAGLTNWCGMAQLLAKAPWNRSKET